jgi:Uma2 family endonuclease
MTLTLERPAFAPRPKRWTKREYTALMEQGAMRGQRIYLFRGELIEMAPMGSPHLIAVNRVNMWACRVFCPEHMVTCQSPFETPGESIPEPDVAVVTEEDFHRKPQPLAADANLSPLAKPSLTVSVAEFLVGI